MNRYPFRTTERSWEEDMAEGSKALEGKVAIVTGAGSSGPGVGTGKAISILLARQGAIVVLVDKFEDRAQETLDTIKSEGGEATIVTADLAQIPECQRIVDETVKAYGGVDILINNAAMSASVSLLDTTPEFYQQMVAVNLTAPFMLSKAAIPEMIKRGYGSIIFITSIAALRGNAGGRGAAAYAASKAGMHGLMTDIAAVFGPQGIRVNCVAPGMINTPMRAGVMAKTGLDVEKLNKQLAQRTALRIEGTAWDIAKAVTFLVGPDGSYITGVLLPVDAGVTQLMG
jgi:NAD(P)-dependent dehydrogenase (short-subunit alcohol dehydrogenase family)